MKKCTLQRAQARISCGFSRSKKA